MSTPITLVFACAHLCDERLFAPQVAALAPNFDCRVFAFTDCDRLEKMAARLLAHTPSRFILAGLSLGGYLAFEIVRQAPERLQGLILMDTRADGDDATRVAGRHRDIALVANEGIAALAPELPQRWMHPLHAHERKKADLLISMALNIGATGQRNQQLAMLARPDSLADLAQITCPTLLLCGRQDLLTPVSRHEEMQCRIANSELEIIEHCGHLASIEQPEVVNALLQKWLQRFTLKAVQVTRTADDEHDNF